MVIYQLGGECQTRKFYFFLCVKMCVKMCVNLCVNISVVMCVNMSENMDSKFPLAPIGVLTPGSAHT